MGFKYTNRYKLSIFILVIDSGVGQVGFLNGLHYRLW